MNCKCLTQLGQRSADRHDDPSERAAKGGDECRVSREGDGGKNMKIKTTVLTLCALFLVLSVPGQAQQPTKVARIGYLAISSRSTSPTRIEAFRQGLRELGYVEGKNIVIEWRSGEGKRERVPALADELVRLNVEVIVTGGPGSTRPAMEATKTIPIVMAQADDPVAEGFVASLARPGGNITGLSNLDSELSGKRLELLKEIAPRLSRAAVFGGSMYPAKGPSLKQVELAAEALGVRLQHVEILDPKDIEPAFRTAVTWRAHGLLMLIGGPILNSHGKQIVDLAVKSRLPAIYERPNDVQAGGLVSYSADIDDLYRRAATYVDKILKGRKPAELPVEQPTKFEFIINLKAAKQIGLTIPPNVLARADRVIR
jgi:putative tryptophan/tyrosine transport system substrate-binding protein